MGDSCSRVAIGMDARDTKPLMGGADKVHALGEETGETVTVKYPDLEQKNLFFMLATMIRCLPTSWFHFFFVEFRAVYFVWIAGHFFFSSINAEKYSMFWTFGNTLGNWNLTTLAFILILNIFAFVRLVMVCGAAPFTDPKYLAFTYNLEGKLWYRIAQKIILLFAVAVSIRMYVFMCLIPERGNEAMSTCSFVTTYWQGLLALVASAEALEGASSKIKKQVYFSVEECNSPDIDWNGDAFQNVKFTRSFRDLLFQSNDAFANKLMTALWVANSSNDGGKLFQCVEKESWEEALRIKAAP